MPTITNIDWELTMVPDPSVATAMIASSHSIFSKMIPAMFQGWGNQAQPAVVQQHVGKHRVKILTKDMGSQAFWLTLYQCQGWPNSAF